MSRPRFGKIIIWSLVIACCFSFASGYGRAVICSDKHGEVALEMLHGSDADHCLTEHLHGQHHHCQSQSHNGTTVLPLEHTCCAACDDFEVSLQIFAPRREQTTTTIAFIAKPELSSAHIHQPRLTTTFFLRPAPPSTKNPSLTHLKSTILII
ncbi:hypothetical protein KAI46_11550 [bacterium]|nr:hypothetical protein [bacterium]